jgi:hypothetical protein
LPVRTGYRFDQNQFGSEFREWRGPVLLTASDRRRLNPANRRAIYVAEKPLPDRNASAAAFAMAPRRNIS